MKMKTTLSLMLSYIAAGVFLSNVAAAEDCYKVNLKKGIVETQCSSVPVVLTVISCSDPTKVQEELELVAKTDCSSKPPKLQMKYKEQTLRSELEPVALWGGINFKVVSTKVEGEAPAAAPAPTIPVNVKVSGFAWVEQENSSNFGYNGGSGIGNFDSSLDNSRQNFGSLMANLQLDISKEKTTLTSIFEVGEILSGETSTGGAQGARQKVIEVRNMFLNHEFNAQWSAKAGLLFLSSDPNSFILADHHSAVSVDYKGSSLSATLWTAKAKDVKPGSTATSTPINAGPPAVTAGTSPIYPDTYAGFLLTPQISEENKLTAFGVYRKTKENLNDSTGTSILGASEYNWLGTTFDHSFNEKCTFQVTGILNQGKFTGEPVGSVGDSFSAQLVDAKFNMNWASSGWSLSLEALATSGSSDGMSAAGKRKAFVSPDPGASYLLTIATSDGADDSPGAPKETIIGNLSQGEGLQIGVVKLTKNFNEKLSGFIRYGSLHAAAKSSTTHADDMGQEYDLNMTYEFSPGTQVQMDYGYLKPGSFYSKTDAAQLFTTRVKFNF